MDHYVCDDCQNEYVFEESWTCCLCQNKSCLKCEPYVAVNDDFECNHTHTNCIQPLYPPKQGSIAPLWDGKCHCHPAIRTLQSEMRDVYWQCDCSEHLVCWKCMTQIDDRENQGGEEKTRDDGPVNVPLPVDIPTIFPLVTLRRQ